MRVALTTTQDTLERLLGVPSLPAVGYRRDVEFPIAGFGMSNNPLLFELYFAMQ